MILWGYLLGLATSQCLERHHRGKTVLQSTSGMRLANLRAACLSSRRRMQRARTESLRDERREAYRLARDSLGKEIKRSKRACFQKLCREANATPWGDAYKMLMARLKGSATPLDRSPEWMETVVQGLFPHHPPHSGIQRHMPNRTYSRMRLASPTSSSLQP